MKNLQKILELINQTGDRFIFEDEKGSLFVISSVADYEKLIFRDKEVKSLSEEELLNKINKDIAVWKEAQQAEEIEKDLSQMDDFKEKEDEDRYYFEPVDEEE